METLKIHTKYRITNKNHQLLARLNTFNTPVAFYFRNKNPRNKTKGQTPELQYESNDVIS